MLARQLLKKIQACPYNVTPKQQKVTYTLLSNLIKGNDCSAKLPNPLTGVQLYEY